MNNIQYYTHLCLCGCGGQIEIKKHHKYYGIPKYVHGHSGRNKYPTEEARQKMSKARKGRILSEETRQKMRKTKLGENHPMFGKHHSEETRQKIGKIKLGENNPNWQNGKSFEPYGLEFNKELKQQVLERDNYECLNPNCEHLSEGLDCHHIDYDKKNNNLENLIILCDSCHTKTNDKKKRQYWTEFYQSIMINRIIDCLL